MTKGLMSTYTRNSSLYLSILIMLQAIWVPFGSNISEYMIPKYRNRAMNVPAITFSLGLMFMAPLAYLIPDWRYLQLAIVLPIAIALFGMW